MMSFAAYDRSSLHRWASSHEILAKPWAEAHPMNCVHIGDAPLYCQQKRETRAGCHGLSWVRPGYRGETPASGRDK